MSVSAKHTSAQKANKRKSSLGHRLMVPSQSGTWRSLTFRHRAGKNINHTFCSVGAERCPFPLPHCHAFPQQALSKGCEATVRCAGDRTTARTSTAAPPGLVQVGREPHISPSRWGPAPPVLHVPWGSARAGVSPRQLPTLQQPAAFPVIHGERC